MPTWNLWQNRVCDKKYVTPTSVTPGLPLPLLPQFSSFIFSYFCCYCFPAPPFITLSITWSHDFSNDNFRFKSSESIHLILIYNPVIIFLSSSKIIFWKKTYFRLSKFIELNKWETRNDCIWLKETEINYRTIFLWFVPLRKDMSIKKDKIVLRENLRSIVRFHIKNDF